MNSRRLGTWTACLALILTAVQGIRSRLYQGRLTEDLRAAIVDGRDQEARRLIHAGADINDVYGWDERCGTLLAGAIQQSSSDTVKRVIALGADGNRRTFRGETPLGVAIKLEDVVAIDLLLAAGANPTLRSPDRRTALEQGLASPDRRIQDLFQHYQTTQRSGKDSTSILPGPQEPNLPPQNAFRQREARPG